MTENQKKNEVVVIGLANNAVAALSADLFKDIDFTGISAAIENIAKYNQNMTIEEKEMATDVVSQWEKDVLGRINEKGHEFKSYIEFLETPGAGGRVYGEMLFDEIGEELAAKTTTETQHQALLNALEALEKHQQNRPQEPIERLDRTAAEKLEEEQKYAVEKAKYRIEENRLIRAVYLAEYEWKKLVRQNKEVKELLKKAKKFTKDIGKFEQTCRDKSQLAKLNIAVSNAGVRDALRDLLNFSSTI